MVKSHDEYDLVLRKSAPVWSRLLGYIRIKYAMDEFFDGKDELKFRRGGKTFATLYIREGYFTLLIIFGKNERAVFETRQAEFPEHIIEFYNKCKTYHDGKWMFFEVYDDRDFDSLIKLLEIKRKPNRKTEKLDNAIISRCGNRCDQCLLHKSNSGNGGNVIFQHGDHKCYHRNDEPENDYSSIHCKGCRDSCEVTACLKERGYSSCIECDYHNCKIESNNFTVPGNCNIGISNGDIERFVLPYCGKERFDEIKSRNSKL